MNKASCAFKETLFNSRVSWTNIVIKVWCINQSLEELNGYGSYLISPVVYKTDCTTSLLPKHTHETWIWIYWKLYLEYGFLESSGRKLVIISIVEIQFKDGWWSVQELWLLVYFILFVVFIKKRIKWASRYYVV